MEILRSLITYKELKFPSKLILNQRLNPLSIPILIINYNQLYYPKQLIDFLLTRGFNNVVIIDNASSYKPLLDYYDEIKSKVTIHRLSDNVGHWVFWKKKDLFKKYAKGYYVVTDADIVPNKLLPVNFMSVLLNKLDTYKRITKVGFALKIDDIPNSYPLKETVLKWEQTFWKTKISEDVYLAELDTTFALYRPGYSPPRPFFSKKFYKGIRMGANFEAQHGGWYLNPSELSEEQKFYQQTANNSNSWKMDQNGKLEGDYKDRY